VSQQGWAASCTRCRSASSGSRLASWTVRSASAARKAPGPLSCAATAKSGPPDKDGLVPALLAAEIAARCGRDPAQLYAELLQARGEPLADRIEAPATAAQKAQLAALAPASISARELAGEAITAVLDHAPGNGAAIGGIKVITKNGWFAARPSGTEDIYKIYGENFSGTGHLQRILKEAQAIVDRAVA